MNVHLLRDVVLLGIDLRLYLLYRRAVLGLERHSVELVSQLLLMTIRLVRLYGLLAHCDLVLQVTNLTLLINLLLEARDREAAHDVDLIINVASKRDLRLCRLGQFLSRVHVGVHREST